ncbi:hypothetical protein FDC58_10790 [Clostridium botulinum]|nr:hypothetical protein KU41_17190 [Clostridium botulinum]KFX56653.1 hypothetical protein KU40_08050 [Clostridium botulinum]NFF24799.1 hypothetical protein [Clostridium botulinum]NFF37292.1 hypothetical protein [Clostridium botulinum]NFH02337.1 hypothetical protein [Clostridium botulinum]
MGIIYSLKLYFFCIIFYFKYMISNKKQPNLEALYKVSKKLNLKITLYRDFYDEHCIKIIISNIGALIR